VEYAVVESHPRAKNAQGWAARQPTTMVSQGPPKSMPNQSLRLFSGRHFSEVEQIQITQLEIRVKAEDEDFVLNVNEDEYIAHLVSEFSIDPLEFNFDSAHATDEEKLIPAERFPPMSFVSHGRSYPKQVFTFHIPFFGAVGLLNVAPNPSLSANPLVTVNTDTKIVSFEAVRFTDSMDQVNSTYDAFVRDAKIQLQNLKSNVDGFHSDLRTRARQIFDKRKAELKKKAELRAALRVPIRRNAAPSTFAVPVRSPKRIVPRPTVAGEAYRIDPTLDATLYQEILQLLHDFGKQLERLPDTYKNKDEETLRDHFLLVLQPHFGLDGSATGETFNAAGKTDILIRYQNQNLFVAEFKFWRGQKQHLDTIDQLLSYLTWRDSKTAIVYFVDGKEIVPPLKAIEDHTPEHPCYVALQHRNEQSWFIYEFNLRGDREKNSNCQSCVFTCHRGKSQGRVRHFSRFFASPLGFPGHFFHHKDSVRTSQTPHSPNATMVS